MAKKDKIFLVTAEEEPVVVEEVGTDSEGEPLLLLQVGGLMTRRELFALFREIQLRYGKKVLSADVTLTLEAMKKRAAKIGSWEVLLKEFFG